MPREPVPSPAVGDEELAVVPDPRVARYAERGLKAVLDGRTEATGYCLSRLIMLETPQAQNEAALILALSEARRGCLNDAESFLQEGMNFRLGNGESVPVSPVAVRIFGHLIEAASERMARTDNASSLLTTTHIRLGQALEVLRDQETVW